ncbi:MULTISPECIES: hypothetical protein [Acinetobacter]|uniref:Uncharacterized protein n=1 Tax=Acinetobacter corruptisaponis TaxID=3045147 RepID=A0ABY8S336_9GAMM|nr:hypothetical protein [Acinetobacter sp. KCTC 92772]WHP05791.1 hypothetical protein QLH32_17585 [Acinetobacter sp. KCTC 92772]
MRYPLDEDTGDFNLPENTILINYDRREKPNEGGGNHWGYYIEVLNISAIDMRVEFDGYQDLADEYWDGSQNENPTLLIDDAKATFCLTPSTP